MSKAASFRLDEFVICAANQTTVPVQVPHGGRFRIHPDKGRVCGPFSLARCDDGWWLIHPDVVGRVRIPNLWRAELYEGVYEDGRVFIAPVTHPLPGKEDWYDTLKHAIRLARKQWVSITSDREQGCYLVRSDDDKPSVEPEWLDCDFGDLVALAFADRIVSTVSQAHKKWPQLAKRTAPEEFEE